MASSSSASPPPPPPAPSQSHSSSPSPSPKHEPRIPPPSKSRKPPPLPWTHQETLALIQAYQQKWYSLKKGQLKAFQWEEVSVTVAARCGFDDPSKTATQCRHKIEKLRKRYRSELQKPNPNSWQYFELFDQMERGPTPLYARPITAVAKSFSHNANSNINNNVSNFNHGYGSLYSNSADYYNNDSHGGGGSDDSDGNLNTGRGVKAAAKNKSKSINNIVGGFGGGDVKGRVTTSAKGIAIERGFSGSGSRSVRVSRNPMNGVRKQYYDVDESDNDDENEEEDEDEDNVVVEEEDERVEAEDVAGMELAAEIRGFTERFIGMESEKMEMMRETERYRMEMEKKRMEMILGAQRKIVGSIGRAFAARKKPKIDQGT